MTRLIPLLLTATLVAQTPLAPPRALRRLGEFDVGEGRATRELSFSGDGRTLAALGESGELLVFDVATGTITTRRLLRPETSAIALSIDGKRLAIATPVRASGIEILDLSSGKTRALTPAGGGSAIAWSPVDATVAAAVGPQTIAIFTGDDLEHSRDLELPQTLTLRQMSFSPDGRELDVITRDGLFAFRLSDGTRRTIAEGKFYGAVRVGTDRWGISYLGSADAPELPAHVTSLGRGRLTIASASDQFVLVGLRSATWFAGQQELRKLPALNALALAPQGNLVAGATATHIELYEPGDAQPRALRGYRARPAAVAVSGDGRHVLALTGVDYTAKPTPNGLTAWDVTTGTLRQVRLEAPCHEVLTQPATNIAILVGRSALHTWDPTTMAVVARLPAPERPFDAAWSPGGRYLWTGPTDGIQARFEIDRVHDLANSNTCLMATPGGSYPLAWSDDGRRVVLARMRLPHGQTCYVDLFVTEDGRALSQTQATGASVRPTSAAWAPGSAQFAVTSAQACRLLDPQTLQETARGPGSEWVRFVDARHVAGSMGNKVFLWRAADGEVVAETLLLPDLAPTRLEAGGFSPRSVGDALGDTLAVAGPVSVHVFRIER